jgi:biotin operon repressor
MSENQTGGQAVEPARPTLGNDNLFYPTGQTNTRTTKTRKGELSDLALNVALGLVMHLLDDEKLSELVKGTGGKFVCHSVLLNLLIHLNGKTKTAWVSDSTIADSLGISRGTVNKCKRVLQLKGLIVDVGVTSAGVRIYEFPLIEQIVSSGQGVTEPVAEAVAQGVGEGVGEGVGTRTHIHNKNKYNNNGYDEQLLEKHYQELWLLATAELPSYLIPTWNKTTFREFLRVMQYAPEWQAEPKLYGLALKSQTGTRTKAGGVIDAMKELEYTPPPPPLVKCPDVPSCNGNTHENEQGIPQRAHNL